MKRAILAILAILPAFAHSAPIHHGLRGSDRQVIRLTPKQRRLDRRERRELEEARSRIPPPCEAFRIRTWVDPRTGVKYRASAYEMMTPQQKRLYDAMEREERFPNASSAKRGCAVIP